MTPFTTWYDDIAPHVAGCPLPLVLQKIRAAAIEYCRLSRTWRYLGVQPVDLVAAQQTYVLGTGATVGALPAGVTVVHVFQANYADEPLEVCTPAGFRELSATWHKDAGEPEAFTLFQDGELSLWRIPEASEAGALELPEVALAPSQAATEVDDRVYERARDIVTLGALALLHQLPKKPFTDLMLGRGLWADFMAKAGSHQAAASGARGHARLRTRTITR